MKTKHTYQEALEVQHSLANNADELGFEVEVSADDEYFRLTFKKMLISADSANSDLYDVDSAIAAFDSELEEIADCIKRWTGVVGKAVEDGFTFNSHWGLDNVLINAEKFLIDATPVEERDYDIVPDFWSNFRGQSQSLEWYDEDNQCCVSESGQIIADQYRDRSFFRVKDGKLSKAEWYEDDQDDVFTYLDVVVTTRGKVVMLLA